MIPVGTCVHLVRFLHSLRPWERESCSFRPEFDLPGCIRADNCPDTGFTDMSALIEDYALIGDCHTGAFVSREGSIDWLCLPRFDSGACFAALLGTRDHGRWLIQPRPKNRPFAADTATTRLSSKRISNGRREGDRRRFHAPADGRARYRADGHRAIGSGPHATGGRHPA